MAAASVIFYQKQKELQDAIKKREEERLRLDSELKTYLQSSNQMSVKLKTAKLKSYYDKICEDAKRSKERNETLLREFVRIDATLASMGARTDQLRRVKKEYEEKMMKKYPNWRELMNPQAQPVDLISSQPPVQKTDVLPQQTAPHSSIQSTRQQTQTFQPIIDQTQTNHSAITAQTQPHEHSTPQPIKQQIQSPVHKSPQSIKHSPVHSTPAAQTHPKIETQPPNVTPISVVHQSTYQDPPTETRDEVESIPGEEEFDIQPVHNITIQKIPVVTRSGSMDPADESDIDSDLDLPLSEGVKLSPEKKSSDKLGVDNPTLQGTTDAVASIETEVVSTSVRSGNSTLRAELTQTGILYLLKFVQDDIKDAFSLEGYYRTTPPDSNNRSNIIHKANKGENMSTIDANLISMVILEQLTLVVRNLVPFGLLRDDTLSSDNTRLTSENIGSNLLEDACDLWDGLFQHFSLLVEYNVMEPKEVAAIFVPGLVADGSVYQQKAFFVLVNLLNKIPKDDVTDASSSVASPQHNSPVKHTPRSQAVPKLQFGSLTEKPFSDDESTSLFTTTSRNQPAIPLNETDAYKNMLSGTRSGAGNHKDEEEEDTDDDVEKQFASVLSPRTPKQSVISPRLNKDTAALFTSKSKTGSLLSARSSKGADELSVEFKNLDIRRRSDSGSISPGAVSPVYIPTAMDHRSTMGSTGSYQLPKRTGVKIGSDLDTDTEFELPKPANQNEDDDDFDFYS